MRRRLPLLMIAPLISIACFTFLLQVCAEIPQIITFQGKVTDNSGNLLNGSYDLTFRIYEAALGGTALWQESHLATQVTKGIFAVPLGVTTPFSLLFDKQYWVSVEVGNDGEMSPRQRLTASPYSLRSATAELADEATHSATADTALNAGALDGRPFNQLGFAPIGAIIAWVKDIPGVPGLPENFAECNGQVLNDPESPLDGQTIPDLNGENRFLRGNATSGGTGGEEKVTLTVDQMPEHSHDTKLYYRTTSGVYGESHFEQPKVDHVRPYGNTGPAGGNQAHENRPPFYNVVWIMRVK